MPRNTVVTREEFIGPERRRRMEETSNINRRIGNRPFSAGNVRANRKFKNGLFSTYGYMAENDKSKAYCDKNGAPKTVHAGKTSLRHRSYDGRAVGAGVPHGNRQLDLSKDVDWTPDEYTNPSTHAYRTHNKHKMAMTSNGFRLGAKKSGGYFDPSVRLMSRNYTYAVDRRMLGWVAPTRVAHQKPFHNSSQSRKLGDKSYVSGHRHFPYHYAPFDEVAQVPTLEFTVASSGFRPQGPSPDGQHWKPNNCNHESQYYTHTAPPEHNAPQDVAMDL